MTELLQRAFDEASKLSTDQQDEFARWILEVLADEEKWNTLFSKPESEDLLEKLANEALAEHHAGRTEDLDPEKL